MNAFDRYFHGKQRAVRPWLLSKVFLCMVALDTWMLMIGHAGRYGVDGFNVAQFRWLDRLEPLPSAGLYVGVLVLTGLCALSVVLGGTHPLACLVLFLLYTFSWSMSMLDSYQHHYFVSSILLCMVFFPRVRASDLYPQPSAASASKSKQKKQTRELEASQKAETAGWIYTVVCGAALAGYALIETKEHSWLLFVACVGVLVAATFAYRRPAVTAPVLTSGFGYSLLGATSFVLYTYTSIAKMDAQWCAGNTIQRISSAATVFAPLVDWVTRFGVPKEKFWSWFATSVIPVELSVACGYLLAVRQDETESRWLRRACMVAFGLAMTLHIGAEAMQLEIGWFSYYMMLLACVYLLPGDTVDKLGTWLSWPARLVDRVLDFGPQTPADSAKQTVALAGVVALMLGAIGHMIDLPGSQTACTIAAVAVLAIAIVSAVRKRAGDVFRAVLAAGLAGTLMLLAIAGSEVRWDFYRYLGGDLRRRNQPEAALEAYERGERYAPRGQSRNDKIQELKQLLGR